MNNQLFVHVKSAKCISVEIDSRDHRKYRDLGKLYSLEDFECKGWKKVSEDPGYRGMPTPKIDYIADHIIRIEGRHAGDFKTIASSKWRIADAAELFNWGELKDDGSLTKEQIYQIDKFICTFKKRFPFVISKHKRCDNQ